MKHFLVVYRRSTGQLLAYEDLGEDAGGAQHRRDEIEKREKDDLDVEVVVLTAVSREALERTHTRYFKSFRELTEALGGALDRAVELEAPVQR